VRTARRILGFFVGTVAVVVLVPIVFALLSVGAMRGYFEDGRCACGYDSFIHLQAGGYFIDTPRHGMPERRVWMLQRQGGEWVAEAVPSPPMTDNFAAIPPSQATPKLRLEGGDLYTSWSGTNWTRHPRVYNPWRIWLTRLRAESPGARISCVNNLKQIGLAFRLWAIDHDGQFPFNVSTNSGGTLQFYAVDEDGFARDPAIHFQVMSNELTLPKILVCPQDRSRKVATSFAGLRSENLSYRMCSGTKLSEATAPREVLMVCPFDGNILYCDGTVKEAKK